MPKKVTLLGPDGQPIKPAAPPKKKKPTKKNKSGFPAPKRTPRRPGQPPLPGATQPRLMTVELRARHNLNGFEYGPGRVTVVQDVAMALLNQDAHAVAHDEKFWAKDRAFLVVGPARAIRVAPELFNGNDYIGAPTVGKVSGSGGWNVG